MTPQQQARLAELWDAGVTTSKIAVEIGSTRSAVCGAARRMNLANRPPRGRLGMTPQQQARLAELWEAGVTTSKIAVEIGSTRSAVCGAARRMNLANRPPRERLGMTPQQQARLADLWDAGATTCVLALNEARPKAI